MKCLLFTACIIAASPSGRGFVRDSLISRDYAYLSAAANPKTSDTAVASVYAQAWISRAKRRSDRRQLCEAYRTMMYLSAEKQAFAYADSIIFVALQSEDIALIGSAYLTRGSLFYSRKKHAKALDEFLLADKYLSRTNDKYLLFKLRYVIAQSKFHLGYYNEAITLYRQCLPYFKQENDKAYLNTLHALSVSYIKVGRHDLAASMIKAGAEASSDLDIPDMICYFMLAEGMNDYHIGNYPECITKVTQAVPGIVANNDFANHATAYAYLGRASWFESEPEEAMAYFRKVDSIFTAKGYIKPDLRDCYELMVAYYERLGDHRHQLFYTKRLVEIDQLFRRDYVYLSRTMDKDYERRKQSELQRATEAQMDSWILASLAGFLSLSGLSGYLYNKNRYNRRKYLELMTCPPRPPLQPDMREIDDGLIKAVLVRLKKFEDGREYLEKDLSLAAVAGILGTNTRYASKIISMYRGKSYVQYLSDLKIDYIVTKLKTDRLYRNYTVRALTAEAGFGSAKNFTRSFKDRTGITPAYFCKRLREE